MNLSRSLSKESYYPDCILKDGDITAVFPTIKVYPGDYVNIRVYNRLPEPTSVHWHGLDVPSIMDGVPDVQPSPAIKPDCYFDYHFKIINPPGTHMYHAHHNTAKQEMMGLAGGLIILDPNSDCLPVDRDFY